MYLNNCMTLNYETQILIKLYIYASNVKIKLLISSRIVLIINVDWYTKTLQQVADCIILHDALLQL